VYNVVGAVEKTACRITGFRGRGGTFCESSRKFWNFNSACR